MVSIYIFVPREFVMLFIMNGPEHTQNPTSSSTRPSEDWGNIVHPIISVETDGMELSLVSCQLRAPSV